jgi:hypothetical protein
MNKTSQTEITLLLNELQCGNKETINKLLPLGENDSGTVRFRRQLPVLYSKMSDKKNESSMRKS